MTARKFDTVEQSALPIIGLRAANAILRQAEVSLSAARRIRQNNKGDVVRLFEQIFGE